jgi:hypothetical protein
MKEQSSQGGKSSRVTKVPSSQVGKSREVSEWARER